ncbi:molybdopterin-guanine dinucleotide biosynthesis protein B [Bacillus sp. MUM 13]|uniref:molybdopterin-guanine dinucleotide biosynthesis protein B n=1 Tax=Bacillus sp. MUM 13 TaxID=1678001 RepID=UPI0008F58F59|nr:molybdopterin-guanine dinucleotide biosynthesis protein B [Bacillus sp. MUM 13]OIK11655.1 molybdopterin-guanine dinucleotide biosynthesis protein B [Bacillus sp. MUM 13]
MVKPMIFQFAGFQNSGKTTIISALIKELRANQFEAAVLKHHGHGGKPDYPSQKDSHKHFHSGAVASLVEGEGTIELLANINKDNTLNKLIEVLSFFHPHVIIVEGYKNEEFPKAVLIRVEEDLRLLKELRSIEAILAWPQMLHAAEEFSGGTIPVFPISGSLFTEWFLDSYLNTSL